MAGTVNQEEALRIKSEPKLEEAPVHGQAKEGQFEQNSDILDQHHRDGTDLATDIEGQDEAVAVQEKPYSAFTSGEKWIIIILISLASVFS